MPGAYDKNRLPSAWMSTHQIIRSRRRTPRRRHQNVTFDNDCVTCHVGQYVSHAILVLRIERVSSHAVKYPRCLGARTILYRGSGRRTTGS